MVNIRSILRTLITIALAASPMCAPGCASPPMLERFEFTRLCMGVQTRIVTHAPTPSAAAAAASHAFDRIAALEQIMSDYRPDSELMTLCARADAGDHGPQPVSPDLFRALAIAQHLAVRTDGAFCATIGRAVALWRESRRSGMLPIESDRLRAVELSNWRNLQVNRSARTVRLLQPGMRLDLGGIGKGYAAHAALNVMREQGLPRSLVSLAGDIAAGDPPPGTEGWRIHLRPGLRDLLLTNAAASTSGDIEQFVEISGHRYSHIVDPRTAIGVVGAPWVTVIADRGERADPLATAACVLGVDNSETLLLDADVSAVFLETAPDGGFVTTILDPRGRLRWHQARPSHTP